MCIFGAGNQSNSPAQEHNGSLEELNGLAGRCFILEPTITDLKRTLKDVLRYTSFFIKLVVVRMISLRFTPMPMFPFVCIHMCVSICMDPGGCVCMSPTWCLTPDILFFDVSILCIQLYVSMIMYPLVCIHLSVSTSI